MKKKMQTLIAKFLGIESTIEAALEGVRKDYAKAIEEIAEETNSRICEVEDAASKVDDLESKVDDIESTVEDINSADYVQESYFEDKINEVETDLSDKIDEAVREALDDEKINVSSEQIEEAVKRVVTKEFILAILAK